MRPVLGGELVCSLLARCSFPPPSTAVTCAVSGGPDSLALVVLAVSAGLEVTAVHVDHGLRLESAGEAERVKEQIARLRVPLETRRISVEPGPNLEARARLARYAALPDGVLTGHTADDQAETVLLNLLRGSGLDGLAGIRTNTRHITTRRPLLRLRRAETRAVCVKMRLSPVEDPSNQDLGFLRNRIRHQLLPDLANLSGRDPVPILTRQAALLADEAELLDRLAAAVDPTDARALTAAHPALARRAVRTWLRDTGGVERHPPSAAEVQRVLAVAAGDIVACELSHRRRVRRSHGRLVLEVAIRMSR